jgi:glutathione peroxidase
MQFGSVMERFRLRVLFVAAWGLCSAFTFSAQAASATSPEADLGTCPVLLQKTFNRLQDDAPQNLCQYSGKVILVVNTASQCGFAPQYEGLEKLYATYGSKGLVVLGFPTNDFGQQEPGKGKEIADFCFNTYGVKFPMFEKSTVIGKTANPLFTDLTKASGTPPRWNFYKYLIGRDGKVIDSYTSFTTPENGKLVAELKKALAQR